MAILGNNDNTNNDDSKKKDDSNNPVSLSGSGSQAASGRVSNFSTGQQQASNVGSGRFTNLQKYLNANQGAGEAMGNRISQKYDNTKDQKTKDISDQNAQIAQNIKTGREALSEGSGYQDQLKNIEQGFNTFGGMDNRTDFDSARQQAIDFTTNPNFSRFQTIQGGNAIDNQAALNAQQNALMAGQDLSAFTQDRLNKINTDQGRYDLMKDAFGNKKNYSSGNARFDQLFLQNDPSNQISSLTNKFNQGNLASNRLIGDINTQGQNLNTLLDNESVLMGNIETQAKATQDAFNTALYGQENLAKNITDVNQARQNYYNDIVDQINSGTISQEAADVLGITNLERYNPTDSITNPYKVTNMTGVNPKSFYTQGNIGTYNLLNDPSAIRAYLTQGRDAMSAQDITSQADFDAYNALRNISGLDTGLISGVSDLGRSIVKSDQKDLAADINAQNQAMLQKDQDGTFSQDQSSFGNSYGQITGTAPGLTRTLQMLEELQTRGVDVFNENANNALMQDRMRSLGRSYLESGGAGPQVASGDWGTWGKNYDVYMPYIQTTDPRAVGYTANAVGVRDAAARNALGRNRDILTDLGYFNELSTGQETETQKDLKKRFGGLL